MANEAPSKNILDSIYEKVAGGVGLIYKHTIAEPAIVRRMVVLIGILVVFWLLLEAVNPLVADYQDKAALDKYQVKLNTANAIAKTPMERAVLSNLTVCVQNFRFVRSQFTSVRPERAEPLCIAASLTQSMVAAGPEKAKEVVTTLDKLGFKTDPKLVEDIGLK